MAFRLFSAGEIAAQRAGRVSRGIRRSQRRACGLWRGDERELRLRSWFSCGCENRGSSSGCGDSVEMCASAWKCAPQNCSDEIGRRLQSRKMLSAAISKYILLRPEPQNTQSGPTFSQQVVQLKNRNTLCIESKVATGSKCATIGSVHKRFFCTSCCIKRSQS